MVEFYDSDNTHKCYFKMKTSDVGLLLEKIQKIIIKYLDNKLTDKSKNFFTKKSNLFFTTNQTNIPINPSSYNFYH